MCVFLISPVPIAEPLTSELIDTPVFYNLAPRPIKYRVSVPIPNQLSLKGKAASDVAEVAKHLNITYDVRDAENAGGIAGCSHIMEFTV